MNDKIISTTEYSKFAFCAGNRTVDVASGHYRRLRDDIKKSGLIVPITTDLVDGKLLIADGQHRFEACKELGLPIQYYISKSSSTKIADLNNLGKAWNQDNYIKSHMLTNDSYRFFKELLDESGLGSSALYQAIFDRALMDKALRGGELQLTKSQANTFRRDILHKLLQIVNVQDGRFRKELSRAKTCAVLANMIRQDNYDHERFLELMSRKTILTAMTTREEAITTLVKNTYNKKLSKSKHLVL